MPWPRRWPTGGSNIVRIDRVADYPVTVLALEVLAPDPDGLRVALAERGMGLDVDVSVQPRGLARRGVHLVVMDVDSTLIQDEVIEVLARFAGREERGPRDHRGGDARASWTSPSRCTTASRCSPGCRRMSSTGPVPRSG